MGLSRLRNISKGILQLICNKKHLDEEMVHIYIEGLVDALEDQADKLPTPCIKLMENIEEIWDFRQFEEISKEEAFLFGSIWGTSKLMKKKIARTKRRSDLSDLVHSYIKYKWIFKEISAKPGIMHKELAHKGGMSASLLTQTLSGMIQNQFITYNHLGREKHYYLLETGEKLYQNMEDEETQKEAPVETSVTALSVDSMQVQKEVPVFKETQFDNVMQRGNLEIYGLVVAAAKKDSFNNYPSSMFDSLTLQNAGNIFQNKVSKERRVPEKGENRCQHMTANLL